MDDLGVPPFKEMPKSYQSQGHHGTPIRSSAQISWHISRLDRLVTCPFSPADPCCRSNLQLPCNSKSLKKLNTKRSKNLPLKLSGNLLNPLFSVAAPFSGLDHARRLDDMLRQPRACEFAMCSIDVSYYVQ